MGRVARWLRGLFGGKKAAVASSGAPPPEEPKPTVKEKKQLWGSFVKSFREKDKRSEAVLVAPYRDAEEQNMRAVAVAAEATAAEAVVLTSSGRVGGWKREEWAAVKIQAAFRACLARRALRALKGLVKLQALVRGNIVRKQAAETLRCMQALVRVQARARACRALLTDRNRLKSGSRTDPGPATPEKSEQPIRGNASKTERSSSILKRNSSRYDEDQGQSSGLRWLDQWMEERPSMDDESNAKILEIDTGRPPHHSSMRKNNNYLHSSWSPLASDSPSKDSTVPSPIKGAFTPSKSEFSGSLFSGYSDHPNYMANTECSRAKVRSQSAPKQRPESEKSASMRRVTVHGLGQKNSSLHAKFSNKAYPGSGRLDRFGMPIRI